MKTSEEKDAETFRKFLTRHCKMFFLMVFMAAVAIAEAIFVFIWITGSTQASGIMPNTIGQCTINYFFIFTINMVLWELAFLGIWLIPAGLVIYYAWYKKLPEKERREYKGGRGHKKDSGALSLLVFLVWLAIVWLDGKWNTPFQDWTLNSWVYTWLTAFLWVLLAVCIFGIVYIGWILSEKNRKCK